MGKILKLDAQTANMIAAGEVVERPMGVVKELVENAIDASAKRITVTLTEGGIQKLSVLDDGIGMDSSDALTAFQRHATSKIHNADDLWSIHTLGFRGEALPSIASVSKVTMHTSDGTEGTAVQIEYGKIISAGPYACNQGTEITVEGLFYQTPARLKHLRSAAYEGSLIQDVLYRFAMSHPEISFLLITDGKEAFRTSGQGSLLEAIYQIYGRQTAESAVPVHYEDYDYTIDGYLVKPFLTRVSRNYMHVFLNGRMVHTYHLYKAVQDGYEDFIVKGRYPIVILNIQMDPQLLDVNVHPSKWEVRLSKEKQLEYLLKDQIRNTLKNTVLAPAAEIQKPKQEYYQPIQMDTDALMPQKKTEPMQTQSVPIQENEEIPAVHEPMPEYTPSIQKFPDMQVIGQLHEKFILCACEAGLAVIDQHAAQERVHYEQLQESLNKTPIMSDCLIPITLKAGSDMVRRIDEINKAVSDMHIVFEPFGADTLIVRSIPMWMHETEEQTLLQDLLDNFAQEKENRYAKLEKKKIATMACHRSIRFNRSLSMTEMNEVVAQLSRCENPYHCPHGRPTFVILDEKTLTKEFLR